MILKAITSDLEQGCFIGGYLYQIWDDFIFCSNFALVDRFRIEEVPGKKMPTMSLCLIIHIN